MIMMIMMLMIIILDRITIILYENNVRISYIIHE